MWNTINTSPPWKPDWLNAKHQSAVRSYGSRDLVVRHGSKTLAFSVSTELSRFAMIFAPLFLIISLVIIWFSSDPDKRAAIILLFAFASSFTFAVTYAIARYHETLGDYIFVCQNTRTVSLPRHNATFTFEDVSCLQWVSGTRGGGQSMNNVDLNILVHDSNRMIRYHLLGNPTRDDATLLAGFIGTTISSVHLPTNFSREADKLTSS